MKTEWTTVNGLAPYSGLVHGFGRRRGEGAEPREQTRERARQAFGLEGRLFFLKQVHGAAVLEAPWEGAPEGDGAVVGDDGLLLAIETADCLPVLLVDPVRRVAAAAHAGWRGTAQSVVGRTVLALADTGSRVEDLRVALGPAIGPCCYEVGDELRSSFGPEAEPFFRPGPRGRPHLDVRGINLQQLRTSGVPSDQVHSLDECTSCRADLYFSYRRDGPGTGRMISVVGWASPHPTSSR